MKTNITSLFQSSLRQSDYEEMELQAEAANLRRVSGAFNPRRCRPAAHELSRERNETSITVPGEHMSDYRELWKAHEHNWKLFHDAVPSSIRFESIPFPPCDSDVLEFTAEVNKLNRDMKAAYRHACMRFHPDKFMQRFGNHILNDDIPRVISRLNEITQAINHQYASSKRLKRVLSEPPR